MPKLVAPLTNLAIKNAKPKQNVYFKSDGKGLFLKIYPNGTKTFVYEFRAPNLKGFKRYNLGRYPDITLEEARKKRDELKEALKQGEYITGKEKSANTLSQVYQLWLTNRKDKITEKYYARIESYFNRFFLPDLGKIPFKNITRKDLITAIEPIIQAEQQATLKKIFDALNSLYKYALLYEYCEHNIIADIDKKSILGKKETTHYPFFKTDEELIKFFRVLDVCIGDERLKVCALFQLYTCVRGENAREAEWGEIDFKNSLWSIPANKMKAKKPHEVFLSESVKKMLISYKKKYLFKGELLFPGFRAPSKPINENAIRVMLRSAGYSKDEITPHGFRATFSTIANERRDEHGLSSDVIELVLAHVEQNKVKDAYNHAKNLKERQKLLQWWSDYLDKMKGIALAQ